MKQIFFSSDHHFLHNNVIKYCNRPYENHEVMNEDLIQKWNAKVGKKDLVYYLGDFAIDKHKPQKVHTDLDSILNRLNGEKILVYGNHDEVYLDFYRPYFIQIEKYLDLKINDLKLSLFHYPIEEWRDQSKGCIHLHGHCHGKSPSILFNRYDVGVDCNDYEPKALDEILLKIKSRDEEIKKEFDIGE